MSDARRAPPRVLDALSAVVLGLAGVALVGMALVQAWQVFARYVLNDSPGWTEPVALLLMSFAVMFGAAVAVRRESHFTFQTFVESAPKPVSALLKTISRLIGAAAGAGLMILGGHLMIDDWVVNLAGAPLPAGLRFSALCVGGALILLFSLERLILGDAPQAEAH